MILISPDEKKNVSSETFNAMNEINVLFNFIFQAHIATHTTSKNVWNARNQMSKYKVQWRIT